MTARSDTRNILLILVLGLVCPLAWFRDYPYIAGADYLANLNPSASLRAGFFVWSDAFLGTTGTGNFEIPYRAFSAFLYFAGISPPLIERAMFYVLFCSSGLSVYLACRVLLAGKKTLVPLLASLLYMFNPWGLVIIWSTYTMSLGSMFGYAYLPLALAVVAYGLKQSKGLRYVFVTLPLLVLLTTASGPMYVTLQLGLAIAYSVFYVTVERGPLRRTVLFISVFMLGWLFLNMFWLLPFLPISLTYAFSSGSGFTGVSNLEIFRALSVPLPAVIRLSGYWVMTYKVGSYPLVPWSPIYGSDLFTELGFLLPIFAFAYPVIRPREKVACFFALLTIASLLIMKGRYPPLGEWTESVFVSTGLIKALRNPYGKLGFYAALGCSFLIASTLDATRCHLARIALSSRGMRKSFSHRLRWMAPLILMVLLIGVLPWPLWTGDVANESAGPIASGKVRIPDYYFRAAEWMNAQEDHFYVFSLPLQISQAGGYYWWNNGSDGYSGDDPTYHMIFSKPFIMFGSSGGGLAGRIAKLIADDLTLNAIPLLSMLNVKYILLHEDTNPVFTESYAISPPFGRLKDILDRSPGLALETAFEKLFFYRNLGWKENIVSIASDVVIVQGNATQVQDLMLGLAARGPLNNLLLLSSQGLEELGAWPIGHGEPVNASRKVARLAVYDGVQDPFDWSFVEEGRFQARYYPDSKTVIAKNRQEVPDALSCQSAEKCPYRFPESPGDVWNATNSTLIFLKSGAGFSITGLEADGGALSIVGVWWQTDWMGMSTRAIDYPIVIPPHQRAIIQIGGRASNVAVQYFDLAALNKTGVDVSPDIAFEEIAPTKYVLRLNLNMPSFIKLNQHFHPGWIASVNGMKLSQQYHLLADGYANSWYVSKTGDLRIVLEYQYQSLFYIGCAISVAFLVLCAAMSLRGHPARYPVRLRFLRRPRAASLTCPREGCAGGAIRIRNAPIRVNGGGVTDCDTHIGSGFSR